MGTATSVTRSLDYFFQYLANYTNENFLYTKWGLPSWVQNCAKQLNATQRQPKTERKFTKKAKFRQIWSRWLQRTSFSQHIATGLKEPECVPGKNF